MTQEQQAKRALIETAIAELQLAINPSADDQTQQMLVKQARQKLFIVQN